MIFENEDDVRNWCNLIGNRKNIAYITDKAEVVLVPDKSTRPLMFGYYKAQDKSIAVKLMKDCGVPTFSVKDFDWSEDKAMPAEDSLKARIAELAKKSQVEKI